MKTTLLLRHWNEPDNNDYWTGTAEEFASLAKLAAQRVRDADGGSVLVLGGMAHGPGEFFRVSWLHTTAYV